MYSYFIGKIVKLNKKTITFENNYIGYLINVSNINKFEEGKVKKLFILKNMTLGRNNHIVEELYGFENYEEKELFIQLLNIPSVGVKTAMLILDNDLNLLKTFVSNGDVGGLCSLNNITPKLATSLASELKCGNSISDKSSIYCDLNKALNSLGYDKNSITNSIKTLEGDLNNSKLELSDLIAKAIRMIAGYKNVD
jgi:Holliday junction DNA helicase RuvA